MSAIDSAYDEAYGMVNSITAKLQDDDYNPTQWNYSKCLFRNNDDE
jgi:predicted RNA-binding protein associated with RNAse of E/G family